MSEQRPQTVPGSPVGAYTQKYKGTFQKLRLKQPVQAVSELQGGVSVIYTEI